MTTSVFDQMEKSWDVDPEIKAAALHQNKINNTEAEAVNNSFIVICP